MKFTSVNPKLIVWDGANAKVLVRFVNGVVETEDARTIAILDTCEEVSRVEQEEQEPPVGLENMTIPQLKAYAEEQGIEIPPEAKKKADIVLVLSED